jgi:hypothetical protein
MLRALILSLATCSIPWIVSAAEPPFTAEIISVEKIWDAGEHNAFTDLLRHKDKWYCTFREGPGHAHGDGQIRILASADGKAWRSVALLALEGGDLRDAKLSALEDGRLMVTTVKWTKEDPKVKHRSLVWMVDPESGKSSTDFIGDDNFWLWRTSWHKGIAYNIGYATHGERAVRLYASKDGRAWETLVENLDVKNKHPNESALGWNEDDTAICLLRCEDPAIAQLGTAQPPYKEWTWRELDQPFGGPNIIRHQNGQWLAAGRVYKPSPHTALCWLDIEGGKLVELAKLPSGGDNSYPGLAWHEGFLWMSYYSTHEGKTSIYFAKLKVIER